MAAQDMINDAVFVPSFGKEPLSMDGHRLSSDTLNEPEDRERNLSVSEIQERFPPGSLSATALPSSLSGLPKPLSKPQPEKYLSGREESDPMVLGERTLLDSHISPDFPSHKSPPTSFTCIRDEPEEFVEHKAPANPVAYYRRSVSAPSHNIDLQSPRLRTSRPPSRSWPSSPIGPSNKEFTFPEQSQQILAGSEQLLMTGKPPGMLWSEGLGTRNHGHPAFVSSGLDDGPYSDSSFVPVNFPVGVESVQAPILQPTACSDTKTSRIATACCDNVNSFKGFVEIENCVRWKVTEVADMCFIYASTEEVYKIDFDRQSMVMIGKGGQGKVYREKSGRYALKECDYHKDVLNITYKLKHPNIISLLGVVLSDPRRSISCYHIFHKMNCDLHQAWAPYSLDGLVKHLSKLSGSEIDLFSSNVLYILYNITEGLVYLESKQIFHGDIKDQNILLCIGCRCGNCFFNCKWCVEKYSVVITDFNSAHLIRGNVPHLHTAGTMGYRAPEVCIEGHPMGLNGCQCTTKSDIYSLGVLMLKMLQCKRDRVEARQEANFSIRKPWLGTDLSQESEVVSVNLMIKKLLQSVRKNNIACVGFLVTLAVQCLETKADCRPSATELLQELRRYNK